MVTSLTENHGGLVYKQWKVISRQYNVGQPKVLGEKSFGFWVETFPSIKKWITLQTSGPDKGDPRDKYGGSNLNEKEF